MMKDLLKMTAMAAGVSLGISGAAAGSTVPCSTLDATVSYATFGSCTASGQDFFADVNAIVTALFADEGISITNAGSFSPGPGTGSEFKGDVPSVGFDIEPDAVGGNINSFEFVSLPTGTIFITFKEGNAFELFGVPLTGLPFTLANHLGNGTSHLSTFAGTVPDTNVVPLPAAGWLLLAGVGGLAAMARRRKAAA